MIMKPHPAKYLIKETILHHTVADLGGGGGGGRGVARISGRGVLKNFSAAALAAYARARI